MPNSALTLEDVDAFYGDARVLEKVSFTLGEGRLLGMLGRNGAGKSTTMAVIVGLLPARGGRVTLFGQSIEKLKPERIARRGVALVPQGRRIFRSLTVSENLLVAGRNPVGGGKPRWTLETIFDTYPRLRERRNHLAAHLSGGEQQMLAIGRALMSNPRVLLMDEPSEGLAPQIVSEVVGMVRALKSEGLSIVLVEQSPKLVLDIADDVVILASGQVAVAEPAEALRNGQIDFAQHLGVF